MLFYKRKNLDSMEFEKNISNYFQKDDILKKYSVFGKKELENNINSNKIEEIPTIVETNVLLNDNSTKLNEESNDLTNMELQNCTNDSKIENNEIKIHR